MDHFSPTNLVLNLTFWLRNEVPPTNPVHLPGSRLRCSDPVDAFASWRIQAGACGLIPLAVRSVQFW
jgi:hypothetical protein